MAELDALKSTKNLNDLAQLLGFTPRGLAYILYKLEPEQKYRTFEIPKKAGGVRTIRAPVAQLRFLQKRLAEHLYECVFDIQKTNPRFWLPSHGFRRGRTIVSNAELHRRRRFVFNVDIEDFFGTINFGRVRGYFIKDRAFELDPSVATIIAQIACYENALPQGSPCSPVISNLIGNMIDLRLLALAKNTKCTYTRYADDLTFSTNEVLFPTEIAVNIAGSTWTIGKRLQTEVERAGFRLNQAKTRMSLRQSRQTVTGLVVNKKPNINQDYYRSARAMCDSLFRTGFYHRPAIDKEATVEWLNNLNPVEGVLSHIYFVKSRRDRSAKVNKLAKLAGELIIPKAPVELYRKFLFYKHFIALKVPLIVTEGISDVTYLKCAIRSLSTNFPSLVTKKGDVSQLLVGILNPTGTAREVLNLGHGASGQAKLVSEYTNQLRKYVHKPLQHPVIILCDSDDGPKTVFKNAKSKSGKDISKTTTNPFYHLGENLYLVKVPEDGGKVDREVEDLFPQKWLDVKLNGKPFDRKKDHGDTTCYGKVVFAESVVRPNADKIDFSEFAKLLDRIASCIAHYKTLGATKPAVAGKPSAAISGS